MTRSRREAQDKNAGQGRNVACEQAGTDGAMTGSLARKRERGRAEGVLLNSEERQCAKQWQVCSSLYVFIWIEESCVG